MRSKASADMADLYWIMRKTCADRVPDILFRITCLGSQCFGRKVCSCTAPTRRQCHHHLRQVNGCYSPSAPFCPGVTKWLWDLRRRKDIIEPSDHSGRPEDPLTGLKVTNFFSLDPFSNLRQIDAPPMYRGQLYWIIYRDGTVQGDIGSGFPITIQQL
jgi:hypothetical protein